MIAATTIAERYEILTEIKTLTDIYKPKLLDINIRYFILKNHPPDSPDVKCAIIEKEYRKNYLEAASKALREEL